MKKVAERRDVARRRQKRQRIITLVVAGLLVALAGVLVAQSFLGKDKAEPGAAGSPSPAVSAEPTTEPTEPAGAVACGGEAPKAANKEKKMYDKAPEMQIDPSKTYTASMETSCGAIEIELFAKETPITVNSFVFLAREGFYDGLTFHRIVPDFVIQGGDPKGDGTGGPGYQFEDEIVDSLKFDQEGLLAMANSGPATNGSQFFIVTGQASHLNGKHTIFGKVTKGMEAVDKIKATEADPSTGTPAEKVYIEKVTITES